MAVTTYVEHVAEIWALGDPGPTGRFVRVLTGQMKDYRGNIIFSGTADECAREQRTWRFPTLLDPLTWEAVDGDVTSDGPQWLLVFEE